MKNLAILLVTTIFLPLGLLAQGEAGRRLQVSVGAGLALPVGAFQKVDTETLFALDPYSNRPVVNGFNKRGNSAAKPGNWVDARAEYLFFNRLAISVQGGYSTNAVAKQEAEDFMNQFIREGGSNHLFEIIQDDYEVRYALAGVGVVQDLGRFRLTVKPLAGYGWLAYPEYRYDISHPTSSLFQYRHTGSTPTSRAFMTGFSLQGHYRLGSRFTAGAEAGYLRADFPYSISLRAFPGGSDTLRKSDEVSYRVLQAGLRLGYRL